MDDVDIMLASNLPDDPADDAWDAGYKRGRAAAVEEYKRVITPPRASDVRAWTSGMDMVQARVAYEVKRVWPGESDLKRGLALNEEAGEVARALLKRDHVRASSTGLVKDMNEAQWNANLRLEVAQVVLVCLDIAASEGFSLIQELTCVVDALADIPANHPSGVMD